MSKRKPNSFTSRFKTTYEAENSEYRRNSEPGEYFVLPTRFPYMLRRNGDYRELESSKPIPRGWVDISGITGPTVRRIDEGYIMQRLGKRPRNISYNQNYINRILDNPKTPKCNREAAIEFVKKHPAHFRPRPTDTDDPALNEYNARLNGDKPDRGFLKRFVRHCRTNPDLRHE